MTNTTQRDEPAGARRPGDQGQGWDERELEDGGAVFGRFSDEDYDGIKEGNGKIPWWLVMIVAVTVFQAFLWTLPWPGFGQRFDTVTTTFVSATGQQPWWDWGYYMILFQIVVVLSGIALVVWLINVQKWKEREEQRKSEEGAQQPRR